MRREVGKRNDRVRRGLMIEEKGVLARLEW